VEETDKREEAGEAGGDINPMENWGRGGGGIDPGRCQ